MVNWKNDELEMVNTGILVLASVKLMHNSLIQPESYMSQMAHVSTCWGWVTVKAC